MNSNFCFFGTEMSQNENMPKVLNVFLNNIKPKTIIEIGTYKGGMSVLFQLFSVSFDCKFVTYDIKDFIVNKNIFKILNIDNRLNDVFNDQTKEEIITLIKSGGTTLILCDGGNKVKEFNLFSKYLKSGDFILAHDYAQNDEIFNEKIKNKIWNWCEIKDSDIEQCCIENNLEKFYLEFENVAMTCRRKK